MLPSEKLRKLIAKENQFDLEKYAWNKDLVDLVMSIDLDPLYEDKITKMESVYKFGFNIGQCGLTARYLVRNIRGSILCYGTCDLLKGTKKANDGNHAWIQINDILIDTTLMINIPLSLIDTLGYHLQKIISPDSALELSEYNTYSNEVVDYENNHGEYQKELFTINKK